MRLFAFNVISYIVLFVSCSPNNVTEDKDLQAFFDENKVSGCFGLFDNGQGEFTLYNPVRFSDSTYLPASTFKIVNSLIGIETGTAKDENSIIKWDSIARGRPECEKDLMMIDAFRISCPTWYQQLARNVGQQKMQYWLDTLGYAAKNAKFIISNNLDTFWLDNTARVTADEQLGLAKKLYFDQLPFQKRTMSMVRKMMLLENNANYKLSYKTGWGTMPNGNQLGWIMGWIEENQHPYFFVLQVESADEKIDMRSVRLNILKSILKKYGFMEGKK